MLERFRHAALLGWARFVSRRPVLVLVVCGLAAAAAVGYAGLRLTFQENRNDLISRDLAWNERFIVWQDHFPGQSDLVVVVDTYGRDGVPSEESQRQARGFIDEYGPRMADLNSVRQAVWGFDPRKVSPKSMRLLPTDEFEKRLTLMAASRPVLESPTPQAMISRTISELRSAGGEMDEGELAASLLSFEDLLGAFTQRMQTPAAEPVDFMAATEEAAGLSDWQYLATPNGRFLIVRITPEPDPGLAFEFMVATRELRQLMDQARAQYPEVDIGMTGIPIVEGDEAAAVQIDSVRSSLLAAVFIAVLLVFAFHGIKTPLMLLITLGVGMAWTFGYLTLAIGHLQVVSVFFTAMLLGLGVDFGVHLITRYDLIRNHYSDDEEGFVQAVDDTFETVGPGVVTGAVTTAVALSTTMFTDFTGVAELGQIAAVGILLCLVSMFAVLPALLRLLKWRCRHARPLEHRRVHFFEERWVMPFVRRPRLTLVGATVLFVLSCAAISQMRFDYDLLSLMPDDTPSVVWAERLQDEGELSIYYGVTVVDDMDAAREMVDRYRKLSVVEQVGGVGLLVPENRDSKLAMIGHVREALEAPLADASSAEPAPPASDPDLVAQLTGLKGALTGAMLVAPQGLRGALVRVGAQIDGFVAAANGLTPEQRAARLAALQRDYEDWRREMARQINAALDPSPLGLDDLPRALMEPYIGEVDGRQRLSIEVYPRVPVGVDPLGPEFLGPFIKQMRTVDPDVTGVIVQYYESGTLIWQSYLGAGVAAMVAVLVLLLIDFRSLRDAVLCLSPVAIGFAMTFGVMYLAGVQINPANIIVLPVMFGIGVDFGVHVVHRYRQAPTRRPLGLTGGAGLSISLTSYTTMIGFGALMTASHRGIAGLGFVLATGILLTVLACWIVMPAWLEVRQQNREKAAARQSNADH